MSLTPPKITYAGVELAANSAIGWRFTTGTRPSTQVFMVHESAWKSKLEAQLGKDNDLVIRDSRGETLTIKKLTLLNVAPSDSPNRVAFVLADLRWRWAYTLISRDYNVPKKTGDRTALLDVPQAGFLTEDEYDYKSFSLEGGDKVWTPKVALEDILGQLSAEGDRKFRWNIGSFPIKESTKERREFTLQNVVLRDQGDVALSRLMAYIPGATLWVDAQGVVQIINGADLDATEAYFKSLPFTTYDGESAAVINRKWTRPKKVVIHYQREVELLLEFEDDYSSSTSANPVFSSPYIENVVQTVDDKTTVTEYDPISRSNVTKKDLPPGTWVEFKAWLAAMDAKRPDNSDPWTFDTIAFHWLKGDLDNALGAGGKDLDEDANVSMRIQAIKQHFRQSFRVNRLLIDRTRDFLNLRVAVLDPVTGARAPGAVWGQACIVPSNKGEMVWRKDAANKYKYYRNVDYLAPSRDTGKRIIETDPGPTRINILDRDLGIFRLDWIVSPYGTEQSFIPCKLKNSVAPSRDLGQQDKTPVAPGVVVEGTDGIFLADKLTYKILVTIVPGAPNNKLAFHRVELGADDVEKFVEGNWRIGKGEGPTLEVFVPPTEATARFAWRDDDPATATVSKLLGLDQKDPIEAGIEGPELDGFFQTNDNRELYSHARAVAAEFYAAFADSLQGRVATALPNNGVKIVGNTSGVAVQAAAAPSGKVTAVHDFPGVQKPISRLALMSESARQVVLGIVRFRGES